MDDDQVSKPKEHDIGMVLDAMSVEELEARIALLQAEITRIEEAIAARRQTRSAAESVFKF